MSRDDAVEPLKDGANLVTRQDDGQMLGPLGADDVVEPRELDAEHLAIEEEQGAQRLVLGGGRDFVVNRERGQEGGDLGAPISIGWRLPWKKMYRLIQWMYAFSVRWL